MVVRQWVVLQQPQSGLGRRIPCKGKYYEYQMIHE